MTNVEQDCSTLPNNACFSSGQFYRTQNVVVSGIEAHKFIPFGTIKRRLQIGLNVAGGVGSVRGTVEKQTVRPEFSFDPTTGRTTVTPREMVETIPAKEELDFLRPFPMGKVQVAVAAIVAPGLKIRFAGGINFPGTNKFSVTGVYLFGAK